MPAPIKSDDLFAQWSRKQWKLHYLFTGQEDFSIDQASEQAPSITGSVKNRISFKPSIA